MANPTTLTGHLWARLRRLWDRLTGAVWYVVCDRCERVFGEVEPGGPRYEFATREAADAAAREEQWLVDRGQTLCPGCVLSDMPGAASW